MQPIICLVAASLQGWLSVACLQPNKEDETQK